MANCICVDASVVAKWAFIEVLTEEAEPIRAAVAGERVRMAVPDSFFVECVSIVYHKLQQGLVNTEEAKSALRILHQVPGQVVAVRDLGESVLTWASGLAISAWDAAYLAVAEQEQCELWTADKELAHRAQQQVGWVRLLGEDSWPKSEAE